MTEEEAKTKWCPHAIASHTDPRRGFRDEDGEPALGSVRPEFPCIASACMAWRWSDEIRMNEDDLYVTDVSTTHGYCGLAGKP